MEKTKQKDQSIKIVQIPNTEVNPRKRRYHSRSYKLKILEELNNCTKPGEKGAVLRREGLYSSTITSWRHQKAEGKLERKSISVNSATRIYELEKENRELKKKLKHAEMIIEVQKKISELIGLEEK